MFTAVGVKPFSRGGKTSSARPSNCDDDCITRLSPERQPGATLSCFHAHFVRKVLTTYNSGKHRMPFSARKLANKVASTGGAEPMKQRLACFYLQVTAIE